MLKDRIEKLFEETMIPEVIRKVGSKYQVQSKKGKNLGTFSSKKAAGKRLGQVEWFKAHPKG